MALDPFNHGTTTVNYRSVDVETAARVSNLLAIGWDVRSATAIEQVDRRHSERNGNYRITTPEGKYMLKGPRWGQAGQAVAIAFMEHCSMHNIPAPSILRPTMPAAAPDYTLTTYVHGEHFDGSRAQLQDTAQQLARLHKTVQHSPLEFSVISTRRAVLRHDASGVRRLATMLAGTPVTNEFDELAVSLAPQMVEASATMPSFSDLPWQAIHYDVHPHNAVYNGPALAALLDFEPVLMSQRARDVAFSAHRLGRTFGERTERQQDIGASLQDRVALFVDAYNTGNPLTDEELVALPDLVADEELVRLMSVISDHYGPNAYAFSVDELRKHATLLAERDFLRQ